MKRQWPGWTPRRGEQPEQHYLVTPRHLAGGGDLRHVTEHLRACGWKDRSAHAGTQTMLENPDRTIRIGFDPHVIPPGWTVSGTPKNGPAWHATFGLRTPVEIIAGFTDALTRPRPARAPNVWTPLTRHGWSTTPGRHYTATNPDHTAALEYRTTSATSGFWWAGARGDHEGGDERVWEAVFSRHTPMHLIAAFSAALADPQPLLRPPGAVPASRYIRAQPVAVLPSQIAARQRERVTAARAATWAGAWTVHRGRTPAPHSSYATSVRTR